MFEGDIDGIAHLPELKRLNLENNRMTGTLSNEMGEDSKLEEGEYGRELFFSHLAFSDVKNSSSFLKSCHNSSLGFESF